MIEKKWSYQPLPSPEELKALSLACKTPAMITCLLWQRGMRSLTQVQSFFNPSLSALHDPFQLQDMDKAVARIEQAIEKQAHICVYGDYDVDGTTSVALLYQALQQLGAKCISFYIPERNREGYGVSTQGIAYAIREKVDLLICVDCGTRAVEPLATAQAHGIDTIICDHHEVGETLPSYVAMLNPKQANCAYPFKGLSACGIVFKLIQALLQARNLQQDLTPYLDLVALSIATDIVPMVGENRVLMYHGLLRLNENPRPGIWALKQSRQQEQPFCVSDVVFGIAPLINAVGRMTHASPAVKLLLTAEREKTHTWAERLASQNIARKQFDEQTTQEALTMAASSPLKNSLVLHKEGWPKGIVGIVAARCVEHYHRPTIILSQEGDTLNGSGRSVPGYNLYEAVHACAPLLTRYGGHAQAVGLTLPLQNLPAFIAQFEEQVNATLLPEHKKPVQWIDQVMTLRELSPAVCHLLTRLAPYGPGHRQPVFATFPITLRDYRIYQGKHVKIFFQEEEEGAVWDAIGFNMATQFLQIYTETAHLAIAYKVSLDQYKGIQRIQLTLKDIKKWPLE